MLEADLAAVVQERLEVLVVVMQIIFISKEQFDEFKIPCIPRLHLFDVIEFAQPAGNSA